VSSVSSEFADSKEPLSDDVLAGVDNSSSGSSALAVSNPGPPQPAASHASSGRSSFGQTALVESVASDIGLSEDPLYTAAALLHAQAANETSSLLLSQAVRFGTSLGSHAAQLVPRSDLFLIEMFFVACSLVALVAMCYLEARPGTVASDHQRHQPSQSSTPRRNSSSDDDFLRAVVPRLSDPLAIGKKHIAQSRNSGSQISTGLHGFSSLDTPVRTSQRRLSLADAEYVVPPQNECHCFAIVEGQIRV
jgi:hypothetical protein